MYKNLRKDGEEICLKFDYLEPVRVVWRFGLNLFIVIFIELLLYFVLMVAIDLNLFIVIFIEHF